MRQHGSGRGSFDRRPGLASRLFPERQIICRSDGRVSYVRLSTGLQLTTTLAFIATAGWLAYASAMVALQSERPAPVVTASLSPPVTQDELKAELDRVRAALTELTAEKDRTSESRAQLSREIDELERRLASLLRTQQSLLDDRGAKRLPDLAEVERALRATGLDPAKLIAQGDEKGGVGGPLVPLPRARADALSSNPTTAALLANMNLL
jgi:hypothetical protein